MEDWNKIIRIRKVCFAILINLANMSKQNSIRKVGYPSIFSHNLFTSLGLSKREHSSVDRNLSVSIGTDFFSLQAAVRSLSTGPTLSFLSSSIIWAWKGFPSKKKKKKALRSNSELLRKSRPCARWVLGSASPVRLAWLLPKGGNDRLQTTLTPWTDRCVCAVCVCAVCVCVIHWVCTQYPVQSGLRWRHLWSVSVRYQDRTHLDTLRPLHTHAHITTGAFVIKAWHQLHTEGTLKHTHTHTDSH